MGYIPENLQKYKLVLEMDDSECVGPIFMGELQGTDNFGNRVFSALCYSRDGVLIRVGAFLLPSRKAHKKVRT